MFPNLEGSDADDIYALNYGDVGGGVCHFFAVDSSGYVQMSGTSFDFYQEFAIHAQQESKIL